MVFRKFLVLLVLHSLVSYLNCQTAIKPKPQPNIMFGYLRCWRCDYDDQNQCVKSFDYTKYRHEECDGKCLKAFEKVEARTKAEIDKAQLSPTIRKCVSQKELSALEKIGINTKNGCHALRTAKRSHKLYCFCDKDQCNFAQTISKISNSKLTVFIFIFLLKTFYL